MELKKKEEEAWVKNVEKQFKKLEKEEKKKKGKKDNKLNGSELLSGNTAFLSTKNATSGLMQTVNVDPQFDLGVTPGGPDDITPGGPDDDPEGYAGY